MDTRYKNAVKSFVTVFFSACRWEAQSLPVSASHHQVNPAQGKEQGEAEDRAVGGSDRSRGALIRAERGRDEQPPDPP